jgi:hypothetical protein
MEYPVNVWSKLAQQIHHPGQFLTAESLNAGTDHFRMRIVIQAAT